VKRTIAVLGMVVAGMCRIGSAETMNASAANPMRAPMVECGVLVGRDGAAFGPGLTCQGNVKRLGFYIFAGQSKVNGYQTGDGVTANFSDRTLGFGIDARIFRLNRFVFGVFGQAAYYGSAVHATYFDPDYEVNVDYRTSDRDPLITVGPEIRFRIFKGISAMIRPGKDFGDNFAATTADGISINGGVLVDARVVGTGVMQLKSLFHSSK